MKRRLIEIAGAGVALILLVGALLLLEYQCPLRAVLGFDCPSCGITRAAASLLRLDFSTAWEQNPLVYLLAALVGVMGVEHLYGRLTARRALCYGLFYLMAAVGLWSVRWVLPVLL